MPEQLAEQFGYVGLLISSFLAATILPFSSEVAVLILAQLGFNKLWILLFATTGNFLGALSNYYLGKLGNRHLLSRFAVRDSDKLAKAQALYERWGAPILFFSWLPVIGDPMTVVPGILDSPVSSFALWVLLGRVLRYIFVLWLSSFF